MGAETAPYFVAKGSIMTTRTVTLCLAGLMISLLPTQQARADRADDFARFWAAVLAVEDRCDDYYSLTDATMGGHLTADEYKRASDAVEELRPIMAKSLSALSCQAAAEEVADMGGLPFLKVWERR